MIRAKSSEYTFFKFWGIKEDGTVNLSTSRKLNLEYNGDKKLKDADFVTQDKNGNYWVNSNWNFVRFIGKAKTKIDGLNNGETLVNVEFQIDNEPYINSNGERAYPKNYKVTVFDFELYGNGNAKKNTTRNIDKAPIVADDTEPQIDDDDDLPF